MAWDGSDHRPELLFGSPTRLRPDRGRAAATARGVWDGSAGSTPTSIAARVESVPFSSRGGPQERRAVGPARACGPRL